MKFQYYNFNYKGANDRELYRKISQGKIEYPSHLTKEARCLISKIMRLNPHERPACEAVSYYLDGVI